MRDPRELDALFAAFVEERDAEALAEVFRRTVPTLLRRARRRLDDREAEDAVQELFLGLWENGSGYEAGRPCLPYLVGVLSRICSRRKRRRVSLTLDPAPADLTREPSELAARAELTSGVRAAIGELPEPYREIVHRYVVRHQTPDEMARELARRPGTVRVQLHRGLRSLRERLPGGLALALLWTWRPGASVQTVVPSGGSLAFVAVALCAAVATWWLVPAAERPTVGTRGAGDVAIAPVAPSAGATTDDVAPRRAVDSAATVRASLHVSVESAEGTPLPFVGVRAWPAGTDPDFGAFEAVTDERGVVAFEELEPGAFHVVADRDVACEVETKPGRRTRRTLVASDGCDLSGVVRRADGDLAAGAGIWVCHEPRQPWEGRVVAVADGDGRFVLHDLPAMSVVGAVLVGSAPSVVEPVGPAPRREIELVLGGAGGGVHGRVLDRAGGPIAGAVVRIGAHPRARFALPNGGYFAALHPGAEAVTDASGRYALVDLPVGPAQLHVRAERHASAFVPIEVVPRASRVRDVRLEPGLRLDGSVVDARGAPVGGAHVVVHGRSVHAWAGVETAASGEFVVAGVDAARAVVEVHAEGFVSWEGLPGDAHLAGEPMRVVLESPTRLEGWVRTDGRALELGVRTSPSAGEPRIVAVAADGAFSVTDPGPDPRFFARRAGDGIWSPCATREVDGGRLEVVAREAVLAPATLELDGFTPAERDDAYLLGTLHGEWYVIRPFAGGGTQRRLPDLAVGEWNLLLLGRSGTCPPVAVGARTISSSGLALRVEAPPRGVLNWSVERRDGAPIQHWQAFVTGPGGVELPLRTTHGRVALSAGPWRLSAVSTSFAVVRELPFVVEPGGETDVRLEREPAWPTQVSFVLPPDVSPDSCNARIVRGEEVVLAAEDQIDDRGFDVAVDGLCETVVVLEAGRYALELAHDGERWSGEFDVGPVAPAAPLRVVLDPVRGR